jgi:hypothetical protein
MNKFNYISYINLSMYEFKYVLIQIILFMANVYFIHH